MWTKQSKIVVFQLCVIIVAMGVMLYFVTYPYVVNENLTPKGVCPPACTTDADAQFALDVFPNVTISYFCWNGIPQAELVPAPDIISGTPFGTPDPTIALHVCKASIRSIPHAAQVFPYLVPQLVYGKCGIVYKCATKYYNP